MLEVVWLLIPEVCNVTGMPVGSPQLECLKQAAVAQQLGSMLAKIQSIAFVWVILCFMTTVHEESRNVHI